jgi:ferrous iron transport protein B
MPVAVNTSAAERTYRVAICGNPNSGKTTIFNAITGLKQRVANYPGVTVEQVSGQFSVGEDNRRRFILLDVPGTYSLAAFSPDEHIAISALSGGDGGQPPPDAIICVIDATNFERGLYLLLQVLEIGKPTVVALNMVDLLEKRGMRIDCDKLSHAIGGFPVVPVVGNRGIGIDRLKEAVAEVIQTPLKFTNKSIYDDITENLLHKLQSRFGDGIRTRADFLRIIFDVDGPAEKQFIREKGDEVRAALAQGREELRKRYPSLSTAETLPLTRRAAEIQAAVMETIRPKQATLTDKADRFLLHPVLGPLVLAVTMLFMFQSIFSWAQPFMDFIDTAFRSLAHGVEALLPEGPLQSLVTDGIIGGVGSVLTFIPQIAILFVFISLLEDSGYMARAAFLVDRLFRWCGLSGKSFIPMLSSFACAVPGIMATRTIEDRKMRFITIMVSPLMSCSARLPIYTIMIAAFIPYRTYLGVINLQGVVLTMLYLLGIVVAVAVSLILKKLLFKSERGTFLMEMPPYRMPTLKSTFIRVYHRIRLFVVRAGTVILAITVLIWALSYYPHLQAVETEFQQRVNTLEQQFRARNEVLQARLAELTGNRSAERSTSVDSLKRTFAQAADTEELAALRDETAAAYPEDRDLLRTLYELQLNKLLYEQSLKNARNERASRHLQGSYLARMGKVVAPVFRPLGWDWKITMATLASFPAREVVIATLGTIYNLGAEVDEMSSSLVDMLRQARWEEGPKQGETVFTPAVALSIMVFFALCCQCGATVVTIRQETRSWRYGAATFTYMTVLAYFLALVTYQFFSKVWY